MNEVACETIQLEVQKANLSVLVKKFHQLHVPWDQLINSVCQELSSKIHESFEANEKLGKLKDRKLIPPNAERIFYSDVEKTVERAIKKFDIQLKNSSSKANPTKSAVLKIILQFSCCRQFFGLFND